MSVTMERLTRHFVPFPLIDDGEVDGCFPLSDDNTEEEEEEEEIGTSLIETSTPPTVFELSNHDTGFGKIDIPIHVETLLDQVEKNMANPNEFQTILGEMTAYSDASFLAAVWSKEQQLLFDGKNWYQWETEAKRWIERDVWMHRMVAECCVLPYRRKQEILIELMKDYESMLGEGATLSYILNQKVNKITKRTNFVRLGDAISHTKIHLKKLRSHIERLHSLPYQIKVLAMAAKVFFSASSKKKKQKMVWGPFPNLLPLEDGTVWTVVEERICHREILPTDLLRFDTPTAPCPAQTLDPAWFDRFNATDLRLIQLLLQQAIFAKKERSVLVLWGLPSESIMDCLHFLRIALGESFCANEQTAYTRVVTKHVPSPASERHFHTQVYQDTILRVFTWLSSLACFGVLFVESFENKISLVPSEIKLAERVTICFDRMVQTIRPNDHFWGSTTSSSPPSSSSQELIPSQSSNIHHAQQKNPLLWILQADT